MTSPSDIDTTATETLSARVKAQTKKDHDLAETSPFIVELMGGERSLHDYALLVAQYFYMYSALDSAVAVTRENTDDPVLKELFDPALDRRSALVKDLQALMPQVGLDSVPCIPATQDYVTRVITTAQEPERLAAHHYLRYLGDLSGGLAIASLVRRHYQATDEQLHMYTFETIQKPKIYKDHYRDLLDQLSFTPEQEEIFITESKLGFGHNKAIFEGLADYTTAQQN